MAAVQAIVDSRLWGTAAVFNSGRDAQGNYLYYFPWISTGDCQPGLFPQAGYWLWDRLILNVELAHQSGGGLASMIRGGVAVTLSAVHVSGAQNQLNYDVLPLLLSLNTFSTTYGNGAIGYKSIDEAILLNYPQVKTAYDEFVASHVEAVALHNQSVSHIYEAWLKDMQTRYPGFDPLASNWDQFLFGVKFGFKGFWSTLATSLKGAVDTAADIVVATVPWWVYAAGGLFLYAQFVKK